MLSLIILLVRTGFFAICIGSPVDVVKSRMMGDSSAYKNRIDCFIKTLKNDGPLAFYKGFSPIFGRLGSWNVIMFLTFEQNCKNKYQSIFSGQQTSDTKKEETSCFCGWYCPCF